MTSDLKVQKASLSFKILFINIIIRFKINFVFYQKTHKS